MSEIEQRYIQELQSLRTKEEYALWFVAKLQLMHDASPESPSQEYANNLQAMRDWNNTKEKKPAFIDSLKTRLGIASAADAQPNNTLSTEGTEFRDVRHWLRSHSWHSIKEAFWFLYRNMQSPEQKLMFRQAIGEALVLCGSTEDLDHKASIDLLYLTAMVEAKEALASYVSAIFNGSLGKDSNVLAHAIAIVKDFSELPEAQEVLQRFTESQHFDTGYLFEVIEMASEYAPDSTLDLLHKYQNDLAVLYTEILQEDEKEWKAFLRALRNLVRVIRKNPQAPAAIDFLQNLFPEVPASEFTQ